MHSCMIRVYELNVSTCINKYMWASTKALPWCGPVCMCGVFAHVCMYERKRVCSCTQVMRVCKDSCTCVWPCTPNVVYMICICVWSCAPTYTHDLYMRMRTYTNIHAWFLYVYDHVHMTLHSPICMNMRAYGLWRSGTTKTLTCQSRHSNCLPLQPSAGYGALISRPRKAVNVPACHSQCPLVFVCIWSNLCSKAHVFLEWNVLHPCRNYWDWPAPFRLQACHRPWLCATWTSFLHKQRALHLSCLKENPHVGTK